MAQCRICEGHFYMHGNICDDCFENGAMELRQKLAEEKTMNQNQPTRDHDLIDKKLQEFQDKFVYDYIDENEGKIKKIYMKADKILEWLRDNLLMDRNQGKLNESALESNQIKPGRSGQPMKDFEKEFYFNWKSEVSSGDPMALYYKIRNWIGRWHRDNN